jgi:hypothetical protein
MPGRETGHFFGSRGASERTELQNPLSEILILGDRLQALAHHLWIDDDAT